MDTVQQLEQQGYTILKDIFPPEAVREIANVISAAGSGQNAAFRKTADLFAIRRVLAEIPALRTLVFTPLFQSWVKTLGGATRALVKSIYFDKPGASNWFVAYHQDLTISVDSKHPLPGFGPWTVKQEQYAVQPPVEILENMVTFRIHLDDTDAQNGALKVVPGSHRKGVYRLETISWETEREETIAVTAGSIMVMKPLLLHASGRTTNGLNRRVLHLEFSGETLPAPVQWAEQLKLMN